MSVRLPRSAAKSATHSASPNERNGKMCRLGVVRALDMSSAAGLPSAEGLPHAMETN